MADPVSMIAIGGTAAGGIISAMGNLFGGESSAAAYRYQAGVAAINKKINLENADYERYVGEVEAQRSGLGTAQRIAAIKAGKGASGIDVGSGSAADIIDSQHAVGLRDQSVIRANAARKAYGFEVRASGNEAETNLLKMAASRAEIAGKIGALSSLVGGATSVASKWLMGSQMGLFGSGRVQPDVGSAVSIYMDE
jgi:hypothetical protein